MSAASLQDAPTAMGDGFDPYLDRVITVTNLKGGVGKTTYTGSLADVLSAQGHKVLVVDLDKQGDLTRDLGVDNDGHDLSVAIFAGQGLPVVPVRDVRAGGGSLHLIPGGQEVTDLATLMATGDDSKRERYIATFRRQLAKAAEGFDVVLIDTPPGDHALILMALRASRFLLIPTRADDRSIDGAEKLVSLRDQALARNPHLQLLGVALFAVSSVAKRLRVDTIEALRSAFGDVNVFDSTIREAGSLSVDMRLKQALLTEVTEMAADASAEAFERVKRGEQRSEKALYTSTADRVLEEYIELSEEIVQRMAAALSAPAAVSL